LSITNKLYAYTTLLLLQYAADNPAARLFFRELLALAGE
jgi:hypothetical protein